MLDRVLVAILTVCTVAALLAVGVFLAVWFRTGDVRAFMVAALLALCALPMARQLISHYWGREEARR